MSGFLGRARFATFLAVSAALLATGIVAGAAGQALIIGESNNSGSAQTTLHTTASGASFTLKNTTNGQTGQFGWSSGLTGVGRGLYGRADSPDGFGVDAFNNAAAGGGGAALRARGGMNPGIMATSDVVGVYSIGGDFGAFEIGDAYGGVDIAGDPGGIGVVGSASLGTGVEGYGEGATGLDSCGGYYCSGGMFTGYNGVLGESNAAGGWALGGVDTGGTGYALFAVGDSLMTGDLFVGGVCTGCTAAMNAINGSNQTIAQGDAVTLLGVATAPDGSVVMVVGKARKGDAVLGIADKGLTLSPETITLKGSTRTEKAFENGKVVDKKVTTKDRTVKAQSRQWLDGQTSVKADGYLRVITSGVYAYKAGDLSAEVGDALAVGATAGKLAKADKDTARGSTVGKFGGKLKDGRTVVLVDPS